MHLRHRCAPKSGTSEVQSRSGESEGFVIWRCRLRSVSYTGCSCFRIGWPDLDFNSQRGLTSSFATSADGWPPCGTNISGRWPKRSTASTFQQVLGKQVFLHSRRERLAGRPLSTPHLQSTFFGLLDGQHGSKRVRWPLCLFVHSVFFSKADALCQPSRLFLSAHGVGS